MHRQLTISSVAVATTLLLFIASASARSAYVGTDSCASCHQNEYQQWQGSHHDMAMRHTNTESVLGDFDYVKFVFDSE